MKSEKEETCENTPVLIQFLPREKEALLKYLRWVFRSFTDYLRIKYVPGTTVSRGYWLCERRQAESPSS